MAQVTAWDDYWSGAGGFEAVGGGQRHKLAGRWRAFFTETGSSRAAPPVVIDIAAGAGAAIAAAASARGDGLFVALDFSVAAVRSACAADRLILGAASDAAQLPLRDRCADFVISQFGLEYAGEGAFAEAARVLAPGGRYGSISHYAGGAIDLECAENERLLGAVGNGGLFAGARRTLAASFAQRSRRDPAPIDRALDAPFASALAAAMSAVRAAPPSAARSTLERFLNDLTRLSARRFAYEPSEALGWIDGMEAALGAYLKRMRSMRASALDRAKIDAIAAQFGAAGLTGFTAEPLYLDDAKPPAAWVLEARRPA